MSEQFKSYNKKVKAGKAPAGGSKQFQKDQRKKAGTGSPSKAKKRPQANLPF